MNTHRTITSALVVTLCLVTAQSAYAATLYRQLDWGMRGTDVSALQSYLASDSLLYPQGLITGYYGPLTVLAVKNFQARYGILRVGRVGPVTLTALNERMGGSSSSSWSQLAAPIISKPMITTAGTSATVSWTLNEPARAVIYYSTSPLVTYERENSVDVSGQTLSSGTGYSSSHSLTIPGLSPNTTYHYLVYVTDEQGNVSVTWPATFIAQ